MAMTTLNARNAWKYSYTLVALLYYICQQQEAELTDQQQATVEYHYQRLGESLGLR